MISYLSQTLSSILKTKGPWTKSRTLTTVCCIILFRHFQIVLKTLKNNKKLSCIPKFNNILKGHGPDLIQFFLVCYVQNTTISEITTQAS